MTTFAYIAFDSRGKSFRGSVQEKSWTQAIRRVKEMGLFPTSVKEKRRPDAARKLGFARSRSLAADRSSFWPRMIKRVPGKVLTAFTRQMATLLDAGIPIVRALRCIEEQAENRPLRGIIGEIVKAIEGGSMFSEALAQHPKVFSRLYSNMIVAGETAGMLENTLARLADFMERSERIKAKIVAAIFYPAAVLVVAMGILAILAVFVIPKFKEVLGDLTGSKDLPAFTEFVLGGSEFIKGHLFAILGVVAGVIAAFRLIRSARIGRVALDRLTLKLPIVGRIARKVALARFARTLGTMLENGVPVLQALTIVRETMGNAIFAQAIQQTRDRVEDGDSLTSPLQASRIFPSTVLSMIDVGEQTGALPNMLLKVAETYDDEVDNNIASALSLLEPVLILFLAIVVGSIVIALFLPLINLDGFEQRSES